MAVLDSYAMGRLCYEWETVLLFFCFHAREREREKLNDEKKQQNGTRVTPVYALLISYWFSNPFLYFFACLRRAVRTTFGTKAGDRTSWFLKKKVVAA